MVKTQRVVITPGEPAGIGPDLVVQLAQREWPVELVVCADATLLTNRAAMLGLPLTLRPYSPNSPAQPQTAGTLTLLPVALRESVTAGQLAVENGHYVVETLARACDGCLNGEFAALITGPVHKGVINDAGIPFTGHTEFFEERSQAKKVVMMLATEELRVALATTHLPLRDIADAITPALLHEVIAILHHDLRTKFGIAEPRILVCGLNPHAGEGGHMGTEEIDTIIPVLDELRAQGMKLNGPLTLRPYSPNSPAQPQTAGTLTLLPVALRESVTAGQLAVENGHYVVETLARACDGCLNGEFAALITGPVHKGVINDAGIPFTGHTEFFEERSQAKKVVMMLATEELRVALATTHLPLRDIADAITPALLHEVIAILHHDLRTKFGIAEPRILVCGLNPHAGEGGHMGTEEIDTIIPVLDELRAQGMKLNGPLPADTLFQPKYLDNADAVLAMYHDQGLPVLKYQGFGRGVNITLGLPFIRTSVDHGTALELAGRGKADVGSFITALNLAIKMIVNTQ